MSSRAQVTQVTHIVVVTIASCLDWQRHPHTVRARIRADLAQQVHRRGLELSGEPKVTVEAVGDGVRVRISSSVEAVRVAAASLADASLVGPVGADARGRLLAQRAALAIERARTGTAQSWVTSVRSAGMRQRGELLRMESVADRLRLPDLAAGPIPRWLTAMDAGEDAGERG